MLKKIIGNAFKGELLIECDGLFRRLVFRSRLNKCERCGGTFRLQISHILPKGKYPRLRYFLGNVIIFDFPCHPEWWHKNPLEAAEFILKTRGEGYREKLLLWDMRLPKLTIHQLNIYKFTFQKELGY